VKEFNYSKNPQRLNAKQFSGLKKESKAIKIKLKLMQKRRNMNKLQGNGDLLIFLWQNLFNRIAFRYKVFASSKV